MQHEPAAEADRPRSRLSAAFLHLQCANRPFWPLVSKYIILMTYGVCKKRKYCNRMSEKKNLSFWWMFMFCMSQKTKQAKQKKNSVCLSVCTWTFAEDTITFEGVSGSKQNMVGVFYVWNVGLVLKSKVKSWSWSWREFWFSQKLCGATPNFVDIFSKYRIAFSNEFHSEILILVMILILILKKIWKKFAEQN